MAIDFINKKYKEHFIVNHIKIKNKSLSKTFWEIICAHQVLSETFLLNYKDHLCWDIISCYQVLSEKFIQKFNKHISWDFISLYQKLSENFIREFKDFVYWHYICESQKLSINFIDEMIQEGFIKEVHIKYLLLNKKINQEELKNYLSI